MVWGPGRRRALAVAFPFLFLFGLIAILAQAQALQTTGPWFTPQVTEVFYSATLVSAVLMIALTAVWAAHRRFILDDRAHGIDLRLAAIHSTLSSGKVDGSVTSTGAEPVSPLSDREPPAMTAGMLQESPVPYVSVDRAGETAARNALEAEAELLKSTQHVFLAQRDSVWPSVAGPIFIGIVYSVIAGTLLPGAEYFLTRNFRLNTMLVLFIAYSWWLLLAWLAVALASNSRAPREAKPAAPVG